MQSIPSRLELYSPVAKKSYKAARDHFVDNLKREYAPTVSKEELIAFQKLTSRNFFLSLLENVVKRNGKYPFFVFAKGKAHVMPEDRVVQCKIGVPPEIATETIQKMERLDRIAIANRLIARDYWEFNSFLDIEEVKDSEEHQQEIQKRLSTLRQLYERVTKK